MLSTFESFFFLPCKKKKKKSTPFDQYNLVRESFFFARLKSKRFTLDKYGAQLGDLDLFPHFNGDFANKTSAYEPFFPNAQKKKNGGIIKIPIPAGIYFWNFSYGDHRKLGRTGNIFKYLLE